MEKLALSVIIIAKNEALNLPRVLDSIITWTDQIIAVVNDCNDNTIEILNRYNVVVYEHQWQGFVQQKNLALSYVTNSWILSLDADEEVSPRMHRDILNFINVKHNYVAASFCRKTQLLNRWIKHGDWYPDRVTRLFKKDSASFVGNYHEKLQINGKTKYYSSNLLHYSFPNLYLFLIKTENFSRNFVSANTLQAKNFSIFNIIVRSGWKFFRGYFIKLGFLDGYPGLIIAIQQAYSTFFRYNALLEDKLKTRVTQSTVRVKYQAEDL